MSPHQLDDALFEALPKPIVDKLLMLIQRLRRVLWLRGGLAVSAVALASILSIMAIDAAVTIFAASVRWSLSLLAVTLTFAAAYRFLYRPLNRRYTLTRIARLIEIRHPELQERISSSVELLSGDEDTRGSEQLIGELVKQAVSEAEHVSPTDEFSKRSVIPYLVGTAAAAAILFGLFVIWPLQTSRLFARALAPYAEIGNVYSWRLRVVPGNIRVAAGDALRVNAAVSGPRTTRAELRREKDDRGETVERMSREFDQEDDVSRFSIDFPTVSKSFRYRVRAGRALSAYYKVDVVPRPEVEEIAVAYNFPDYTLLPSVLETNATGDIAAPVGTEVEVIAQFNKSVDSAEMIVNGSPLAEATEQTGDGPAPRRTWAMTLAPKMSGNWSLHLKDTFGFENPPLIRTLKAIPDQVPAVSISSPEETELSMTPTDRLRINYIVREDFGLDGVDLLMGIDGNELESHAQYEPVRLEAREGIWVGSIPVDLATLDLRKAHTIRLRVQVADNLPEDLNGPQLGKSKIIVIKIDRDADLLAEQTAEAQAKEIKAALESVKQRLEEAQKTAEKQPEKVAKEELAEETREELDKIQHETAASEVAMKDLAERVQETPFADLADEMEAAQEDHITPAKENAERIPLSDESEDRRSQAQEMKQDLAQALAEVEDMLKHVDEVVKDLETLAQLEDLAAQEERLAEQAAALAEEDAMQPLPEEWQQQQDAMAEELAALLAEEQAALMAQLESDRNEAMELAQDARDLSAEQEQLRAALSKNADQDQLRDALMDEIARRQKAVADDAQQLGEQAQEQGRKEKALDAGQQQAEQAANQLQEDQLEAAAEAAERAQEQFQQAAEQMGKAAREAAMQEENAAENWEDRQNQTEMAKEAGDLAERQEDLLAAMQAMKEGNLAEAMEALQDAIAEDAEGLAEEIADLHERAQDLGLAQPVTAPAGEAAQDMAQAADQAEAAADAMEQVPQAMQAQQNAAREMQGAANNLDRMSQEMAKMMEALPAAEMAAPLLDPSLMTEALAQATAAAEAPEAFQSSLASQAAAQNLMQMARQMSQQLGAPLQSEQQQRQQAMRPSLPGEVSDASMRGGQSFLSEAVPKILQMLGISQSDWFKIRGDIRSEVAGTAAAGAPTEYRDLVKRYFEEVARRGSDEEK